MKRVLCLSGLTLAASLIAMPLAAQSAQSKAPRTPQQRQETRIDRTEKRTDRLERHEERVDRRDAAEKTDRKVTDARQETLDKRIERNENLRTRVTPLLPPGMTLSQASSGFQNEGQFVAALRVSKNLGIPFADLKAKMTGSNPMSLGQAVKALKPTADADKEVAKAEAEAKAMMK